MRASEPAMQRPALLNRFNLCWNLAGVGGGVMVWASGGHLVVCCTIAGGCMLAGAAMVSYLLPPISRAAGTRLHVAREQRADPSTPQAAGTGGPGTLSTIALLFRDPLTRWTLVLAAITPPFEACILNLRYAPVGGEGSCCVPTFVTPCLSALGVCPPWALAGGWATVRPIRRCRRGLWLGTLPWVRRWYRGAPAAHACMAPGMHRGDPKVSLALTARWRVLVLAPKRAACGSAAAPLVPHM